MRPRMAIIPRLVNSMWQNMDRPHTLMDQHFGQNFNTDKFIRQMDRFFDQVDRQFFDRRYPSSYYRPWTMIADDEESGSSVIKPDKDKFHVALDVGQFKPEEITLKVVDNHIVIEGKHEEKPDEHGIISRHFVRKYLIPDMCDTEKAAGAITSDGILSITVPLKQEAIDQKKERVLKIEHVKKENNKNEQHHIEDQKIAQKQ